MENFETRQMEVLKRQITKYVNERKEYKKNTNKFSTTERLIEIQSKALDYAKKVIQIANRETEEARTRLRNFSAYHRKELKRKNETIKNIQSTN
eukprot:297650_1